MSQPPHNPYAPPAATSAFTDTKRAKRDRVSLINRRTTAVLLELAFWRLTGGALLSTLLARSGVSTAAAAMLASMPYWLFRDVLGLSTVTKRLVGLRLVNADRTKTPTVGQRLLRNLPLVVPLMSLVEYFIAYYGDAQMRRLGDRMAGTCVIDATPERDRGSYSLPLVGALALNWLVGAIIAAFIAMVH